jgi:hypothetical protein
MIWKKIGSRAYVILALITATIFFYPLIFEDQTLFFRDIQSIFYPMKYFLARSFASGAIPFWCPLYFCGAPFMSDIQTGVFYFPSDFSNGSVLPFAQFLFDLARFLCFCFVYLFIRAIGCLSLLLFFQPSLRLWRLVFIVNLPNNLAVITWHPAILWSIKKLYRKERFPVISLQ